MNNSFENKFREFYENEYERSVSLTTIPQNNDFMYGLILSQISPYLANGLSVLDLGCNTGALSLYMADAGCHVTGIDIAKNAIDAANQSAKYSEVQNVKFEQMDFLNEWVEPEIFDFVLCNHVVEHIPNDIDFVKKIHFSTKPGGRLLLSVPSTYSSLYRIHKIITGKFTWDEEVGHLRRYNQTTIVDLVEKAGYEIEKIEFLDSILREWTILFKPLRWTLRIFSRKYICNFFNYADKILAHFLFPATICVHAKKNS